MIAFKPYQSKPVERQAFQITSNMEWAKVAEATYMIHLPDMGEPTPDMIKFKAYEEPKVGDWVVRLTAEDTYHCTDAVFRERNIVPDSE